MIKLLKYSSQKKNLRQLVPVLFSQEFEKKIMRKKKQNLILKVDSKSSRLYLIDI